MSSAVTLQVPHIISGQLRLGGDSEYTTRVGERFTAPELNLDELVVPRCVPGPAFDVPISEILDFLSETGTKLDFDSNPYLAEVADLMSQVSPHSRRLVEQEYRFLPLMFDRGTLGFQIDRELGDGVLDSWRPVHRPGLPLAQIRAFPPRLIHIMAGSGAGGSAMSIVRGALTKGINLLKLPSNDLFTAPAILRTMADIDPNHPTVRSFSAVYWRGGDRKVEAPLFRPQYFDKLVAWGGEKTIRHAVRYIGPGFELVSYDPKTSISLIGREAFVDDQTIHHVAALGARDGSVMNQEGCVASRFQFVEGDPDEIDRYCELLAIELSRDTEWADGTCWRTPADIRDQVDGLRFTGGCKVFGDFDGRGLVIRSAEPVEFHPSAKTINVVPVDTLLQGASHANVATQTVGVYPASRKNQVRDILAGAGVQRIVTLGHAIALLSQNGLPHDGSFPLQRLMRWVSDEES